MQKSEADWQIVVMQGDPETTCRSDPLVQWRLFVGWDLGKLLRPNPGLPHWKSWLGSGNHPKMAERFRLVKYDNLPRWVGIFTELSNYHQLSFG